MRADAEREELTLAEACTRPGGDPVLARSAAGWCFRLGEQPTRARLDLSRRDTGYVPLGLQRFPSTARSSSPCPRFLMAAVSSSYIRKPEYPAQVPLQELGRSIRRVGRWTI
jgi:hypothetical protein